MSLQTLSYTRQLEYVIKDILLPVYDKHYRSRGELPPYTQFPQGLLKTVCKPPRTCALFKPKNSILT
jgi:hypothetical protein